MQAKKKVSILNVQKSVLDVYACIVSLWCQITAYLRLQKPVSEAAEKQAKTARIKGLRRRRDWQSDGGKIVANTEYDASWNVCQTSSSDSIWRNRVAHRDRDTQQCISEIFWRKIRSTPQTPGTFLTLKLKDSERAIQPVVVIKSSFLQARWQFTLVNRLYVQ